LTSHKKTLFFVLVFRPENFEAFIATTKISVSLKKKKKKEKKKKRPITITGLLLMLLPRFKDM